MRAVIYTRVSHDPTGEAASVERQLHACRAFAESRQWTVVDVQSDNDISAYSGRERPGFDALRRAITTGRAEVVLVWKLDRLVRRPAEFEQFWGDCERGGVNLASCTEPIDSSTQLGLALVRVLVTFASLESASKSLRLRAAHADAARRGRPPSVRRAFGINHDWTEVIEWEAHELRGAAERIVRGESLNSLERDWRRRGLVTVRGTRWTAAAIRRTLLQPRMVGDREHLGEVVARDCFPPILERRTWDRLVVILSDPARRRERPTTIRHILGGLATCGRCGNTLHFSSQPSRGPTYSCTGRLESCRGISIKAEPLEAQVIAAAVAREPTDANLSAAAPVNAHDIARRLRDLNHDYYARRGIERAEFLLLRQRLHDSAVPPPTDEPRRLTEAEWTALAQPERRSVLAELIARVEIAPAYKTGVFDPARVTIVWWDDLRAGRRSRRVSPMTRLLEVALTKGGRGPWMTFENARATLGNLTPAAFAAHVLDARVPVYRHDRQLRFSRADVYAQLEAARVVR